MKYDLPEGFEELLGGFGALPDKAKKPHAGMTTEELIRNMEHNAKVANEIAKNKDS
jgi:hypothetical protein